MRNQCEYCGAKFGLVMYRWFGHRFHTPACKAAYVESMIVQRAWLLGQSQR
jgi:hypothetical protein